MKDSDLYFLLKTLTKNELGRFSDLMQQNALGKVRYRQQVKKLFELLNNHIQTKDNLDLEKKAICKILFPKHPISVAKVERVMHELNILLGQFLLTEDYFSEDFFWDRQVRLAVIMRMKGAENKALHYVRQTLKSINETPLKGEKHFKIGYEASMLQYVINTQNRKSKNDLEIANVLYSLDLYYTCQKLQLVNNFVLANIFFKMSEPGVDINIHVDPDILQNEPYLRILFKTYKLFINPNPHKEEFTELAALLQKYEEYIEPNTLRNQYTYLRSYCSFLIIHGSRHLFPILHTLHKDSLQKGYILHFGKIPIDTYQSIANAAIRSGELEWAYEFANQYKEIILGDIDDISVTYSIIMAQYHHIKKNFQEALSFLPQSSQSLIRYVNIKVLEIKIYYDKADDLFLYKLDAFKVFISRSGRKRISDLQIENIINFVNFLVQISNTAKGDHERASRIRTRIQERTKVREKEWLLEKTDELMQ